ncbi:MAG: HNH/endonuclease VII fold putative polymorphic toxin, partial [Thermoactinomyces sp.]
KEVIETTAEHPFWVAEKGWVQAKDLQPGDQLETDQGQHVKVTQIAKQEKQTTVYNFEVKDYHTYYVSGLHLLVHNMCGKIFESRRAAFRAAKRDAGLRSNAHPYQVKSVNMEDRNGKVILDSNYRSIKTREYYFKRSNDLEDIVIQEHSAGHYYGEGGIGDQGPHFNVRPISKRRTGKVEGTLEHYEFIK